MYCILVGNQASSKNLEIDQPCFITVMIIDPTAFNPHSNDIVRTRTVPSSGHLTAFPNITGEAGTAAGRL